MVPFILEPEGFGVNSACVSTPKDLARNMGRGSWNTTVTMPAKVSLWKRPRN